MNKIKFLRSILVVALFTFFCTVNINAQNNVGIGTVTPDPSAKLDVSSASLGLLIPRMNTTQRNAIVKPANGLLVFDTDLNSLYYYNTKDSKWYSILSTNTNTNVITTNYTMTGSETYLTVNGTAAFSVDLVSAVGNPGKTIIVRNISGTFNVTIKPITGQFLYPLLAGSATTFTLAPYDVIRLYSDGNGNWIAF